MKKLLLYLVSIIIVFTAIFTFMDLDSILGRDAPVKIGILPTRSELQRNFYSDRRVLFIYGASNPAFAEAYRTAAERFNARSRWTELEIRSDRETTAEDLQGKTVFLLGTPSSNSILAEMLPRLPVQFHPNGFTIFQKEYRDSTDTFTLFYPNPANPNFSMNILSGNRDAFILNALEDRLFSVFQMTGDYCIFRENRCLALGFFSQEASTRWQFDPAAHRDFEAETRVELETPFYRFFLHNMNLPGGNLQQIASWLEHKIPAIRQLFNLKNPLPVIDYHIYSSFEDKGLITRSTKLSEYQIREHAVHTVIENGVRGDDGVQDAALLLRSQIGAPKQIVLETGLSVYFSHNWRNQGYEYWASRLYLSGNAAPLADLLDNERLALESDLVMEPLAGTFVAYLLESWGKEKFRENYLFWQPAAEEIAALETGWKHYLETLSEKYREQISGVRAQFPGVNDFQKGFCHAHEGYQIYNGYVSKKSDQALAKLVQMGTNAVSITPFTFMGDPHKPAFLRYSRHSGSENDESVIHASLAAKQLGLVVMLKPHIWLGRGWPGEIEMQSEADWERFFGYYYRWMRHYALLAEMYQIEILCLGVELCKTTLDHENRWSELIRRMRNLYSGQLTYAANWGEEFENLEFWRELDFIGMNCYYPLSKKDSPSEKDLQTGAEEMVQKVESVYNRYQKPLLFTEVGFTSTPAPWKQPHEPSRGNREINLNDQARCYEAVFRSLHGKPWVKGIYWWKWPTYLEYGGEEDNDFTPNNKPAEEVVRRWYVKQW